MRVLTLCVLLILVSHVLMESMDELVFRRAADHGTFFLAAFDYELVWMKHAARRIESCQWWCVFLQGYCRCLRCR